MSNVPAVIGVIAASGVIHEEQIRKFFVERQAVTDMSAVLVTPEEFKTLGINPAKLPATIGVTSEGKYWFNQAQLSHQRSNQNLMALVVLILLGVICISVLIASLITV